MNRKLLNMYLICQVYTWGKGYCGALGHGEEIDKTTPELIDRIKSNIAVQVGVCAAYGDSDIG